LNRALGVQLTYPDYLERQETKGVLELRREGERAFMIRHKDSLKNEEVRINLEKYRLEKANKKRNRAERQNV
jgi:hypothetical protein